MIISFIIIGFLNSKMGREKSNETTSRTDRRKEKSNQKKREKDIPPAPIFLTT